MNRPDPVGGDRKGGDAEPLVETMPVALLDEPLEYLFADHFRQRKVCATLRLFAEKGHADLRKARIVAAFLTHDLPLHHEDEDEDLFPAVRRRAMPEDRLAAVLKRLSEDHRRSQSRVDAIVRALSARQPGRLVRFEPAVRRSIEEYSADERQHLATENGVVLPIARIRLTADDVKAISRGMKARRGITN